MGFRINITRRILVRLAIFTTIVAAAILFDVYFESMLPELETVQEESENHSTESGTFYLIAPANTISIKNSDNKLTERKLQFNSHCKFLRKHYQMRNYQVLKAEVKQQTTPIIQTYHYLVFQNYFFPQPEEYPLV